MAEQNYMTALENLGGGQAQIARAQSALAAELLKTVESVHTLSVYMDSLEIFKSRIMAALRARLAELKVEVRENIR